MTDAPALEVVGASVAFGATRALDAVDLSVGAGEVVAVIGPSGSGKSTLLRAIAGLQPLDAGTVRRAGRDLAGVAPHRRGLGMMFQQPALFPHRDVAGNVAFGLERSGTAAGERARAVERLLDLVGLPGFGDRSVLDLSGGEQQRVALARALAPAPEVLLLDEPLGALDAALRDRLVGDLGRLATELGLTVVAVTHDRDEAFALADRILVLDHGRVVQTGTPEELWARPTARVVAELLRIGTVVSGVRSAGAVAGPWGEVADPGPDGAVAVLVRPGSVRIDPSGPVRATVATVAFRGVTTVLDLVGDDGTTIRAEVAATSTPGRGDSVVFAVDPAGVQVLPA